jgi:hypothetical protein
MFAGIKFVKKDKASSDQVVKEEEQKSVDSINLAL